VTPCYARTKDCSAATNEVKQLTLAELLAVAALGAAGQYPLTYNKVLRATEAFTITTIAAAIIAVT
jgi:hypothetical protein